MKYVVSGYIGFDNFGDELIAHSLAQKLKDEQAEKITFISSNPEKTAKIHQQNACGMFNFIKPILDSDVLISGGGSLLQDVTSLGSLVYYLGVIYTALIFGKKVEIYAQGIGPINSAIGRFFTKFALEKAYKISVRDEESKKLLKSWGIESELIKDPVFNLKLPQKNKKGTVGIQLRSFKTLTDKFLDLLSDEVAKRFSDKKTVILSLQDSADEEVCRNFELKLRAKGLTDVTTLTRMSTDEVLSEICDLEYLISMRFHACAVGVISGVKTLVINYDPKVEKLASEYNLPILNLNPEEFSSAPFNKLTECTND